MAQRVKLHARRLMAFCPENDLDSTATRRLRKTSARPRSLLSPWCLSQPTAFLGVSQLPYEEGSLGSGEKIDFMRENPEVGALRNEYGADLVVLVGELYDVCGIA